MRGSVKTASEPGDQSEPSDDPDADRGALRNPVPEESVGCLVGRLPMCPLLEIYPGLSCPCHDPSPSVF